MLTLGTRDRYNGSNGFAVLCFRVVLTITVIEGLHDCTRFSVLVTTPVFENNIVFAVTARLKSVFRGFVSNNLNFLVN